MSEALQRQLRSENDQLRLQVNDLHRSLHNLKLQSKQLSKQLAAADQRAGQFENQSMQMGEQCQREKAEKERVMLAYKKLLKKQQQGTTILID